MRASMRFAHLLALCMLVSVSCAPLQRWIINLVSPEYAAEGAESEFSPIFVGPDENRERLAISLRRVATELPQITDVQFVPGGEEMLVATKGGQLFLVRRATGDKTPVFRFDVTTVSEQGLLGLALHPGFSSNGRLFVNYTTSVRGQDVSRVSEWRVDRPTDLASARLSDERVLMEVEQPYQNHNAGQVAFGPDGYLYIGWGDGGWRADPRGNGQNPATLLGSMLRIDVDEWATDRPYAIPRDNPFVERSGYRPEMFAIGLRNPWRFSFDSRGRLVVADVGQDLFEEVDIVLAGDNLGWNIREAAHCFEPPENCRTSGLTDPIYEYGREEGQSITGGFVYTGSRIPGLRNRYVFGDFVSGRLWAIELPENARDRVPAAVSLGKWPILPSTFARDPNGEIYVADFGGGAIYRLDPE
ncbi:MAG: PQQ-dependent sugar dehydrogenase [Spirochaetales bacterium]|nr:PQQ-dependent sugar dehydrogenase [Leptospiraceae bacterium]MCP5483148.1 PQQ-dependent sugar dehydrogenase [Spirochaetales bacterium]MCP5484588.1 PQQ-dependent sugar dehydrogenase [Spirochaetales bacterium]